MVHTVRGISLEEEQRLELREIKRRGEMRGVGRDHIGRETTIDR